MLTVMTHITRRFPELGFPNRVFPSSWLSSPSLKSIPFSSFSNENSEDCAKGDGDNEKGGSDGSRNEDHFFTLGVDRTFDVPADLRSRYLKLMGKFHPDHQQGVVDPDQSVLLASDVTNAYSIISDDHGRASHLLELLGGEPPSEDDGRSSSGGGGLVGTEFLMETMELRSEVEDATVAGNDRRLRELLTANDKATEKTVAGLGNAFRREDLERARALTAELRYWVRIREAIVDGISSPE